MKFEELLEKLNLKDKFSGNEIQFKKCILDKGNLSAEFKFISNSDVEDEDVSILEKSLEKFLELNIKCNFEVISALSVEDIVINTILEYNPSVQTCIDEIELNVTEEYITIAPPKEELYYSFTSNGLGERLRESLSAFKDYKIEFLKPEVTCSCTTEDLEKKLDEIEQFEKNLVQNTETVREVFKEEKKVEKEFKYGKKDICETTQIINVNLNQPKVTIIGKIFKIDIKEIRDSKFIYTFSLSDHTGSYYAKVFLSEDKKEEFDANLRTGTTVLITGNPQYDNFLRDQSLFIRYLEIVSEEVPVDEQEIKRVELRLHTRMSTMNGINPFDDFAKRAKELGMDTIAITDVADVQGFPEAMDASKKYGLKILYGLDANYVDDSPKILINRENPSMEGRTFVVFDIETTGFSPRTDEITEIGAVKVKDGVIVDHYSQLINPQRSIPEEVQRLTGITPALIAEEPTIDKVIFDFYDFCKDSVLVAHNATFDTRFIRRDMLKHNLNFEFDIVDTLYLARALVPDMKRFNLGALSKKFGVSLVNAHRAVNDAQATALVFIKLLEMAEAESAICDLNILSRNINPAILFEVPVSILVKNTTGLRNLYKLVSASHLKYVSRVAKVPKSLIEKYRDGLLIGSGNTKSPLFEAVLNLEDEDKIREIAKFFDYIELQPIEDNIELIQSGMVKDKRELESINIYLYNLGRELNIPVVATGDVFYLEPEDDLTRRIILSSQTPPVRGANVPKTFYFRTTDEMLRSFSYLGERESYEVVVENTNKIADSIDKLDPIPEGTYPPSIDGAEEDLRKICYDKAHEIYGETLPKLVEDRLEIELKSIIDNGYAVLYIIAQKLVAKSNNDGYLVGSRGSVGSSFAATMASITEVNPLVPHYICPECKHSEFFTKGEVGSGVDLDDKNCPICGAKMKKDGHDIPFEVFLGFNGDKEPDIDLNFAGEYQPNAHKYTEELFGEGYVFRAGTIGTVAEKTAYGYVRKYFESQSIHSAEVDRLVNNLVGIKRTSGQHPGGVMIVPKSKEIFDFTPIQHPADDINSTVITTHFDYNFIHGKILKLDILGHDGPTIIKMLEDFTGVDSNKIALNDPKTLSLFRTAEALNLNTDVFETKTGTLGIPEFGTNFVKQMLIETEPKNFADLVRISGLSHGTDVWTNNAQSLVNDGRAELSDVICTREDIMTYLIRAGAENKMAFDTMEKVRKGKGLTDEQKGIMKNLALPEWYIESCEKIKYMFPKAHAVAYVTQSFRIAYFKLYYPLAFYATFFTIKLNDFDGELVLKGSEAVKNRIEEIKSSDTLTAKEKGQLTILEVVLEMYARGYEFENADIYESESSRFSIKNNKVLLPLRAFIGVGESVAKQIVAERENGAFISIEDFKKRTGTGKSTTEILKQNHLLDDFQETNQISLFSF
ncbi:PolC-type DNA polymerase III [Peptoniphilus asaccharolyticus]